MCVCREETLHVVRVWVQSVSREYVWKERMECEYRFYREYTYIDGGIQRECVLQVG